MTSYQFCKIAAITSQIYFWFLVWSCVTFSKALSYWHTKFRPDTPIYGRDNTTSGSSKQTAGILKFHLRFWFWPLHYHWHVNMRCLPNFVQIGWSPTELWRHIDFTNHKSTSGLWFGHICHLGRSKAIGIPHFDQISQSWYYDFRFLKTNGHHIEILLPVLIMTFSLS